MKIRLTEEAMQERRKAIIHAAFRLFCDHGIKIVSLSMISKKAKVSENTIYRYFGNKEKLVLEVFVILWDNAMQSVEQIVDRVPNYEAMTGYGQIQVWIEGFRHLYEIDRELLLFSYEANLYLLRQNIKLSKFHQDTLMKSFYSHCLAALEKGKEDGSIPIKENCEDVFYAIWGAIRGYTAKIVIYQLLYGEDSPWESRYQTMENGILSALRSGWNAE